MEYESGVDDWESWSAKHDAVIVVDSGFVDWVNGNVYLTETSPLIDVGCTFADTDPALPGIQFVPEFGLGGYLHIVDSDGNGVATVNIGAYEYQPYQVPDPNAANNRGRPPL